MAISSRGVMKAKTTAHKKSVSRNVAKKATAGVSTKTVPIEYFAKPDSKNRVTLRADHAEYYSVAHLVGGIIVLKPQSEFRLDDLPREVLAMIDEASENFRAGRVSDPIDLD